MNQNSSGVSQEGDIGTEGLLVKFAGKWVRAFIENPGDLKDDRKAEELRQQIEFFLANRPKDKIFYATSLRGTVPGFCVIWYMLGNTRVQVNAIISTPEKERQKKLLKAHISS